MAEAHHETAESKGGPKQGGEFRTGPVAGTAFIHGTTFARKAVQYAEVGGLAMFEGDIVLGTVAEVAAATDRATAGAAADPGPGLRSIGITGPQFRWPNATIPFEIDAGLPNPQRVTDAIAHWHANTRIRLVERTAANGTQFPDFVRFVSGGGCSSQIGRQGGLQTITLGPNCNTGNAIHEIGHTVGLWHEQSREDRDTFVRIVWANIAPEKQHNFYQHIADGDDLGAYDYGSVMHYPRDAFSTNGQDTIVPLQTVPPGVTIGQRAGLSAGDIAGVNALYPTLTTQKEVPKDPIFDGTGKEIRKDPIFDGTVKEIRKDPILDGTVKEVPRDPIGPGGTWVEGTFGGLGATPFVMGGQGAFAGNDAGAGADVFGQLQAFGEALAALQQQQAQLAAAYDALVAALGGAGG